MPQIKFQKPRAPLNVDEGTNLMEALLAGGVPVASSCRGDGVCAKCRIEIISTNKSPDDSQKSLSPENSREAYLRERHNIPKNERISCQVQVIGDLEINTPYW
jgi:2Fe-2S ferredoxin